VTPAGAEGLLRTFRLRHPKEDRAHIECG